MHSGPSAINRVARSALAPARGRGPGTRLCGQRLGPRESKASVSRSASSGASRTSSVVSWPRLRRAAPGLPPALRQLHRSALSAAVKGKVQRLRQSDSAARHPRRAAAIRRAVDDPITARSSWPTPCRAGSAAWAPGRPASRRTAPGRTATSRVSTVALVGFRGGDRHVTLPGRRQGCRAGLCRVGARCARAGRSRGRAAASLARCPGADGATSAAATSSPPWC